MSEDTIDVNEEQFLAIVQDLVKAFCRTLETEYRAGTMADAIVHTLAGLEYRAGTMADAIVHTLAGLTYGTVQFSGELERRIAALEVKLAG